MKTLKEEIGTWILVLALAWLFISVTVFTFRHSWMTDIERLLYIPEALMFETVTMDEVRNK